MSLSNQRASLFHNVALREINDEFYQTTLDEILESRCHDLIKRVCTHTPKITNDLQALRYIFLSGIYLKSFHIISVKPHLLSFLLSNHYPNHHDNLPPDNDLKEALSALHQLSENHPSAEPIQFFLFFLYALELCDRELIQQLPDLQFFRLPITLSDYFNQYKTAYEQIKNPTEGQQESFIHGCRMYAEAGSLAADRFLGNDNENILIPLLISRAKIFYDRLTANYLISTTFFSENTERYSYLIKVFQFIYLGNLLTTSEEIRLFFLADIIIQSQNGNDDAAYFLAKKFEGFFPTEYNRFQARYYCDAYLTRENTPIERRRIIAQRLVDLHDGTDSQSMENRLALSSELGNAWHSYRLAQHKWKRHEYKEALDLFLLALKNNLSHNCNSNILMYIEEILPAEHPELIDNIYNIFAWYMSKFTLSTHPNVVDLALRHLKDIKDENLINRWFSFRDMKYHRLNDLAYSMVPLLCSDTVKAIKQTVAERQMVHNIMISRLNK